MIEKGEKLFPSCGKGLYFYVTVGHSIQEFSFFCLGIEPLDNFITGNSYSLLFQSSWTAPIWNATRCSTRKVFSNSRLFSKSNL